MYIYILSPLQIARPAFKICIPLATNGSVSSDILSSFPFLVHCSLRQHVSYISQILQKRSLSTAGLQVSIKITWSKKVQLSL
jgi:hypothetical protein